MLRKNRTLVAIALGAFLGAPLAFAKTTDPPGAAPTLVPADHLFMLKSDLGSPPGITVTNPEISAGTYAKKPADDANKYVLKSSTGAKTIGLSDDLAESMLGGTEVRPTGTILAKLTSELKADGVYGILAKKLIGAPTTAPG